MRIPKPGEDENETDRGGEDENETDGGCEDENENSRGGEDEDELMVQTSWLSSTWTGGGGQGGQNRGRTNKLLLHSSYDGDYKIIR